MYSKGDIVVVSFPYSDLLNAKKRPMVIIGQKGQDIIGCAITSNLQSEGIPIDKGVLPLDSKIKHWQINTILKGLIVKKIAKLSDEKYNDLITNIVRFISI